MRCKNCNGDGGRKGNRHVKYRRYTCSNSYGGEDLAVEISLPDFNSYTDSDYGSSSSSYSSDSSYSSGSSDSGYSSSYD